MVKSVSLPSPLRNLVVEHERLFLDEEIVIKIIVAGLVIVFPGEPLIASISSQKVNI